MRRIILALMLSLLPAAALAQNDSFLSLNGTFKSPFSVSNTWTVPQMFTGGVALSFINPTLVTSVGAKCDGVTDDTAAFAAGVTSLPRGGVLRAPDGVQCIVAGQVSIAASTSSAAEFPGATPQGPSSPARRRRRSTASRGRAGRPVAWSTCASMRLRAPAPPALCP